MRTLSRRLSAPSRLSPAGGAAEAFSTNEQLRIHLPEAGLVDTANTPQSLSQRTAFWGVTMLTAMGVGIALWQIGRPDAYTTAIAAVLISAVVSSIVGFAFSAIAAAMLFHVIDDRLAVVEIMLIASIALQTTCVASLWRAISVKRMIWLLAGGFTSLPLGIYLTLHADARVYKTAFGMFLLLYVAIAFLLPKLTKGRDGKLFQVALGASGGLLAPLAALPGAVVAVWCNGRDWPKIERRAVYQPFILVMQVATLLILSAGGKASGHIFDYAAFSIPAVVGAIVGMQIFRRLSDARFSQLVNVFVAFSGLALLVKCLL